MYLCILLLSILENSPTMKISDITLKQFTIVSQLTTGRQVVRPKEPQAEEQKVTAEGEQKEKESVPGVLPSGFQYPLSGKAFTN